MPVNRGGAHTQYIKIHIFGITGPGVFGMLRLDPETARVLILLTTTRIPGQFYRTAAGRDRGGGGVLLGHVVPWLVLATDDLGRCAVTGTVTNLHPFLRIDVSFSKHSSSSSGPTPGVRQKSVPVVGIPGAF